MDRGLTGTILAVLASLILLNNKVHSTVDLETTTDLSTDDYITTEPPTGAPQSCDSDDYININCAIENVNCFYNDTLTTYCTYYYDLFPTTIKTTLAAVWTTLVTNWVTPPFVGPSSNTATSTVDPADLLRTKQPPHTIPCPKCSKLDDGTVACSANQVWCHQYEGCWYYTDRQGVLTKGCLDIIPASSGFSPYECTSFYENRFCAKGECISCDFFGTGAGNTITSSLWNIILAVGIIQCLR